MDANHENCPLTDALMNTVDALVVIADPAGRILQFNKACESVTGFSAADVVGRSLVDTLIPIEQRRDVAAVIGELSTSGTNRFENDWITADGRRRRITWSNATMSDATGRVTAVIGTGIDITDQRLLESRLAQEDRLDSVGRLAAGIAHDFNNTLTTLCLRIERLAARDLDDDSRTDVDAITSMIGRTQDLITELLSFSSPHRPAPARIDVNAEVRRMREGLAALVGGDIEVEVALASEPATVLIDPVGFGQAITNLIINARDAMPNGGRLMLATAIATIEPGTAPSARVPGRLPPGSYVRLSVTDTGTGIHSDDVARVFDPYFTTKPSGRGTGLGLATTYATITQSRGAITVDSQFGRGATFDVWLPIATERSEAVSGTGPASSAAPGTDTHLALVVDDDGDIRDALVEELGRLGCDIITATTGEQALRHLDAPIDLLLTDVQLPDIGGDEVAIRFLRHRPGLKVVYASGAPVSQYPRNLPADANVLRKPFTTIDLIEAIRGHRGSAARAAPMSGDQNSDPATIGQPDGANR